MSSEVPEKKENPKSELSKQIGHLFCKTCGVILKRSEKEDGEGVCAPCYIRMVGKRELLGILKVLFEMTDPKERQAFIEEHMKKVW
jgi:hypothetical protein